MPKPPAKSQAPHKYVITVPRSTIRQSNRAKHAKVEPKEKLSLLYMCFNCHCFGALYGCAPGKRPFLIGQVCLKNEQGTSAFKQELQSIARAEGAQLIDNSQNTKEELRAIGNPNFKKTLSSPLINIGVDRGHGVGLTANNVDMPRNEVAIGFSEGSTPSDAHRFASTVIGKLGQHWHIEIVPNPAESGALGMKNCNQQ